MVVVLPGWAASPVIVAGAGFRLVDDGPGRRLHLPDHPQTRIRALRDRDVETAVRGGIDGDRGLDESLALRVVEDAGIGDPEAGRNRIEVVQVNNRLARTAFAPYRKVAVDGLDHDAGP